MSSSVTIPSVGSKAVNSVPLYGGYESTESPVPGDFRSFKAFEEAYDQWLNNLDGDDEEDDIAFVESEWTSARELWEETYLDKLDDWVQGNHKGRAFREEEFVNLATDFLQKDIEAEDAYAIAREYYKENLALSTVLARTEWIDPDFIRAGSTQTRHEESQVHIQTIKTQMIEGEWEWQREPLPEFVKAEDGYFYPVSGNHRSKAVQLANEEQEKPFRIFGRVRAGTIQQAQLEAIRSKSNNYHGQPESDADYRCRIYKLLDLIRVWDDATQIREIKYIKPNDKLSAERIQKAIKTIQDGTDDLLKGWSSRMIAAYLHRPNSYNVVAKVIAAYREKAEPVTTDSESEQPSPPPIPQRKSSSGGGGGSSSVRSELREKARSLGLPTSSKQVFPETSGNDHLRNSSYHDVDDRFGATPPSTPSPPPEKLRRDYLIAFMSNVAEMDSAMVGEALMAINNWLALRGRIDLMQQLTDIATEIKSLE